MAFGFARVNRETRPEAAASGRESEAPLPFSLGEAAEDHPPFEFEHVHGDTCSCGLRGE